MTLCPEKYSFRYAGSMER